MHAAVDYRPLMPSDAGVLVAALPALLGGEWTEQGLQRLAMQHQVRVAVDRYSAGVVGFAEFHFVVDECQLYNLAVLPTWQRQGYGQALLQQVLVEAAAAQMLQAFLEVRESNLAARRLYEQAGFHLVGLRKGYYPPLQTGQIREAALLYQRAL